MTLICSYDTPIYNNNKLFQNPKIQCKNIYYLDEDKKKHLLYQQILTWVDL